MYKILIADDETIIREGIKTLYDWNVIGFQICGEACNGDQALSLIRAQRPDVVLLDIRMPGMTGLEVISTAREEGFEGTVIILSGYSDFKYAQEAIRYRVMDYLTKPVDEDDLLNILNRIKTELDERKASSADSREMLTLAKKSRLSDFLSGKIPYSERLTEDCELTDSCYQVVLTEKYGLSEEDASYDFAELFRLSGISMRSFEALQVEGSSCLLLKGESAISRFRDFLERFEREAHPQKDSPLDTLFFTYGHIVEESSDLPLSYEDARWLLERRFFCDQGQHSLGFMHLPELKNTSPVLSKEMLSQYAEKLLTTISAFNRNQVAEILTQLKKVLYSASEPTGEIRLFLSDLFLQLKAQLSYRNSSAEVCFQSNADIIRFIQESNYLYEIILYFSHSFEEVMAALGNFSRDSVVNDVVYYVEHNYSDNITLESIAPLFGYNSSYLGKLFTKKMGLPFNTYVDHVRLDRSKEILLREDLKIYAVAEQVGYHNVDYFHIKFKKYTGMSPAEYRKKHKTDT